MKILKLTPAHFLYSALAVMALAALRWLLKPMPHQTPIRPAI
jgi:hypothetical protein